ncbi:hypothetical protein [Desulfosarcina ovata]|uniref:CRISPR-associated nuclease/helicase Cas3 domain-containing protein n=1 Tax=Desulfosarcina ovata subsp. ovata TaxID=2752305 RepID=A0A5K8A3X1_9BACT|nr:hypothetical protein [Desulfosarcina ovata]BBO87126.1 hypothetical protein DSCOOX_03060 [Desulfosarcina ovata subsp. ovata]
MPSAIVIITKVNPRLCRGTSIIEQTAQVFRLQPIENIRKRLKTEAKPLYVVSTSLVEAGVDLDFPVVYRALAGLDSIAQAAGRCNREGRLPNYGKTVIFLPEKQPSYVQAPASLALEYLLKPVK